MNNHNYDSNQYHDHGHPCIVTAPSPAALHCHTNSNRAQPQYYPNPHPHPQQLPLPHLHTHTHTQLSPHHERQPIVVHDHDVLSGRGVNIAHHAGNERFRTLITTYHDENYCSSYSASEKRAVAAEIIMHIHSLDPPGRFLKRAGKGQVSRGLSGPWQVLTDKEACKKTCQALRDCNRSDRSGYAEGVARPRDVEIMAQRVSETGLTTKQRATFAAANAATEAAHAAQKAASESLKRRRPDSEGHSLINTSISAQMKSCSVEPTRGSTTGINSHGLSHGHVNSPSSHLRSPPNHLNSPQTHTTQSTTPSMSTGSASCISFHHSNMPAQLMMPQNLQRQNHSGAPAPFMNQGHVTLQPQLQQPYQYLPFPTNIISQYPGPAQQQIDNNLVINTPNKSMGIAHQIRHFTPSAIAPASANREYSTSPIKKQRSTDDTEPSIVSGSSTTSTPLDGCNASHMAYNQGPVPYPETDIGLSNLACPLPSASPAVEQEDHIADSASAGVAGLFRIKEDEADADTNESKHSWDVGTGEGVESDVDQYAGSLHSYDEM